jgi:CRISPR-associated protein Cst1
MLTCHAGRERPEDVLMQDIDTFAAEAEELYMSPLMQSYLTVLFTANGPITQPSHDMAKRLEEARRLLGLHRTQGGPEADGCAFCGRPAVERLHREMLPLTSGQGPGNFFPYGRSGVLACGLCVVSLLALGTGAPSCSGRALVVEAEDPRLLLQITKGWYPEMLRLAHLSQVTGKKVPAFRHPLTRIVEALVHLQEGRSEEDIERATPVRAGLTVYHLSNSGQGPDIDIRRLPSPIVRFVWRAGLPKYGPAWQEVVGQHWQPGEKGDERIHRRNAVYDALFTLPEQAGRFVRRFLLPPAVEQARNRQEELEPGALKDRGEDRWNLVQLFLREVMGMDEGRIAAIRNLGDVLADEVVGNDDAQLARRVLMADDYRSVRALLIRTSVKRVRGGGDPLTSLDDFLKVFEEGDELRRIDWRLAWDLTCIRFIEILGKHGWFTAHRETAVEVEESSSDRLPT